MEKLSKYLYVKLINPDKTQYPCNFEFECIADTFDSKFENVGIFFLYYRGELIYIGYTNNQDNVLAERVVRQLATITLRDHRIQFTKAALNALKDNDVFNTYFNIPEPVVAKTDFVTSINRIKYAAHHWDEFKNFNSEMLSRFEIEWYPQPDLKGYRSIEELCSGLKAQYKPRCNKEYTPPKL
jgi:hypothetical protein